VAAKYGISACLPGAYSAWIGGGEDPRRARFDPWLDAVPVVEDVVVAAGAWRSMTEVTVSGDGVAFGPTVRGSSATMRTSGTEGGRNTDVTFAVQTAGRGRLARGGCSGGGG